MSQVNINNLRSFLTKIVATQVKTTVPAYTNKFAVVNAVTSTSSMMNINPKTGSTTVTTETGTIVFTQPVINPLPINTTTAFVSTKNDQVSVSSKGEVDTIITSQILTVLSLTQLNTGSNTLNNSIDNINNNITTDFWNPQLNIDQLIDGYTSYPYIVNYTFSEKKSIFKLFIKNNISNLNYNFPGFTNIKIYPTDDPSNYINVTPSIDTNNLYTNETQLLLLDDTGSPYFLDIDKLTLEITMIPKTSESYNEYTYGPNTGVIYNTLLNEGKYQTAVTNEYIYKSSDYGSNWSQVTTIPKNWTSVSVSSSGQYQTAVVNGEYIYISSDYGATWTPITTYSKNWTAVSVSSSGEYQTAVTNGEYIYISSDYGANWTQITSYSKNWSSVTMSDDGIIQYASANTNDYIYISIDYGVTWNVTSSPQKNWKSVSVSYNGSIINAVVYGEFRYYSLNYGSNWTQNIVTQYLSAPGTYQSTNLGQNWNSVSSNTNGFSFFCIDAGQLYNSTLADDTALARNFLSSNWTSISCSNSGKYVSACSSNNIIYKSSNFGYDWTSSNSSSSNWSSISISRGYSNTDSTVGIRAGDYVSYNNSNGEIDKWSSPVFVENFSTLTGTSDIGNKNYFSSNNGNIQIVASNDSNAYYLSNNGTTWSIQSDSGLGTDDMVISDDGQYGLYTKRGVFGQYTTSNQMSSNFNKGRAPNYTNNYSNSIDLYKCAMSSDGKYQFYIGQYTGTGTNYFGTNYIFYKKNYNIGDNLYWTLRNYTPSFGTITYVDSFVDINGNLFIVYNSTTANAPQIIRVTSSSDYSSGSITTLASNTIVYSVSFNKTNNSGTDCQYITLIGWNSSTSQPVIYNTNNSGSSYTSTNITVVDPDPSQNPNGIVNTAVKVSSDGQSQIVVFTYKYPLNQPVIPSVVYYTNNAGTTWTKTTQNLYINILRSKKPIVANDDFSYITICGGFAQGNVSAGNISTIKPCTYYSTDEGVTWNFNSSINPATELQVIAFYYAKTQTNKTYFQVKDLNQTQVLGVSDNGFKMTKDLRVTNSNGYVIGGTMTIGPDESSALLNNYSLNVDGTISCRNVVTLSDKRFKNILGNVSDKESYEKISKLNIINYKYIDRKDDRIYAGMVAQDVYDIFDNAVDIRSSTYMNNEGTIEIPDIYSIKYNVINSYLISAFKYSQQYINKIEKECNNLKNELNTIKLALNLTTSNSVSTSQSSTEINSTPSLISNFIQNSNTENNIFVDENSDIYIETTYQFQ